MGVMSQERLGIGMKVGLTMSENTVEIMVFTWGRRTAMNEAQLELSVMELFQNEGYEYIAGESILREASDVLLKDDLRMYLMTKYADDGITASEVESIILGLIRSSYDPLYDANKEVLTKIISGFVFRREDKTKKDLFIRLIDFDKVDANIFKVVNQVEIQGKSELRIPDAVVYINGLPIVVIEFKSATGEKATIHNAYEQLTIRYTRDIPDLMRWMRFFINLILPHSLKEHRLNSWNVLIMRSNMCKSRMIWKSVLWLALRG